ncbi:glycerol-3-phosphate dehydrogenase/oxidase [bacterium]|nr:MAG: glycerol-3-phosphate dehydrogenase/oxidase [bacterium]
MNTLKTQRNQLFEDIENQEWDVVVIGAGATGAGVALDAAKRGLKTLLIDKGDFAGQTSSASTKLIHGGVRYLEKAVKDLDPGQLSLVFEALRERSTMLKLAPHLTEIRPIIIPCYSLIELAYFKTGTFFYDKLAPSDDDFPDSRMLTKDQVLSLVPELQNEQLAGGILYTDGQFDDAAYTLELVKTASFFGARVINYASCQSLEKDSTGKITSVHVFDEINQTKHLIKTRFTVNCAGPFSDHVRQFAKPEATERLRPSQGIHLVFDRDLLGGNSGFLIPKTEDGRLIFALPWFEGVLIGTTEREMQDEEDYHQIFEEDVQYLLEYLQKYVSKPIHRTDIKSILVGVRPLVSSEKANTSELIRNHEIELIEEARFLSVLGGKWTTYRKMAEDAVDEVCKQLTIDADSETEETFLMHSLSFDEYEELIKEYQLDTILKDYLFKYGKDVLKVLSYSTNKKTERIDANYPYIWEEIDYSIEHSYALKPSDVLARRTRIQFSNVELAKRIAPEVVNRLAKYHGYSETEKQKMLSEYLATVTYSFK